MQSTVELPSREGTALLGEDSHHVSDDVVDPYEPRLGAPGCGHDARSLGERGYGTRLVALAVAGLVGLGLLAHNAGLGPAGFSGRRAAPREAMVKLALKSQCSTMDEDCRSTRCCKMPGTTCFAKNSEWAQCRAECVPGRDPADHDPGFWSCGELGPRTPGPPPQPDYSLAPAPWVRENCTADGEDCSHTKCCKEKGKQCYKKAKGWSACKADCVPGGPDPVDADSHPWDCTVMGMRTPGPASGWGTPGDWVEERCSGTFENCKQSKCCKAQGHQCYKKTEAWAMCLPTCTPGPLLTDADPLPWNCTRMGGRTPGIAKVSAKVKVAHWVKDRCSKGGENCRSSMCCVDPTMQCYERDEGHAGCFRGCVPGTNSYDPDKGNWTCKKLGTRTPRAWGSPSLYCFHVMMINSYEAKIVRQELNLNGGVGIFACEQYDVFASDGEAWLGDGPLGKVRTHHFNAAPVGKSVDGTAANTALFRNVWEAIKYIGRYKLTDWTIKVDPDAVVFPHRLQQQLRQHPKTNPKGQYIVNCNKKWMKPMMFGSLEAISREALETYYENEGECLSHVAQWGEDRWLGDCLEKLGASGTQDFDLVGDKVCKGADCSDGKAAYHWFKDADSWKKCYELATR
mmetsp:Transcript_12917/g.36824  ORF Transcript_12917/g.36824 Transcript_12917/m.36824 type:complete len:626 (+) Transcript_12917:67-1944(+)